MFFPIELEKIIEKSINYCELRVQEIENLRVSLLNGDIIQNSNSKSKGISARSFYNGKWGFSSSCDIDEKTAIKLMSESSDNAIFISKNSKPKNLPSRSSSFIFNYDEYNKNNLKDINHMSFLKEIDNYILNKYPDLLSRSITLMQQIFKKELATSDGGRLSILYPRSYIYLTFTIEKNAEPIELTDVYGGIGRFNNNFNSTEVMHKNIDTLYENLKKKSEGVYAESGIKKCILDAKISGMLAHEAIGHTVEADLVLGGSVAKDYMNLQVASPLVTLIDYAHHMNNDLCPAPVFIDDEGTLAEDAVIIENGILKRYLHSKETAEIFNMRLTGNARAYSYSDEPLVRMRNTAIVPGKNKLQDMIASIDDGYYFTHTSNGQADTTAEFMFSITYGYEIKKGKIGKAIKDTTISGVAFDLLKTVDMISDDFYWDSSGYCGKKQPMPVGLGGPAIKCEVMVGGR